MSEQSAGNNPPNLQRRVYDWLTPHEGGRAGHYVDWFILLLIAASVFAVTMETVGDWATRFAGAFHAFEVLSVMIFSVEYVGRLWTAPLDPEYRGGSVVGRLRYAARPLLVIDLLAILPFYLTALGGGLDLRFLRALRLIRVFRLTRYSKGVEAFTRVLKERQDKLIIATSANFLVLLIASSFMYYIEHSAQPEVFSSIPATLWWGVVTLTTVGYGDVVPVTALGQLVGALVAMLGIGMFAVPAALIATGFTAAAGLEEEGNGE